MQAKFTSHRLFCNAEFLNLFSSIILLEADGNLERTVRTVVPWQKVSSLVPSSFQANCTMLPPLNCNCCFRYHRQLLRAHSCTTCKAPASSPRREVWTPSRLESLLHAKWSITPPATTPRFQSQENFSQSYYTTLDHSCTLSWLTFLATSATVADVPGLVRDLVSFDQDCARNRSFGASKWYPT
jgi:hypothetical protein